jgi:hypothetical protein
MDSPLSQSSTARMKKRWRWPVLTTTNSRLAASIKHKFEVVAAAGVAQSKIFSARGAFVQL